MPIRVGINGFGRMGRLALRAGWHRPDLDFVHVNEIAGGPDTAAHLLTFDAVHGRWTEPVSSALDALVIGYLGLVKELVARLKKELGGNPKVIATGGMAEMISAWTEVIDVVSPRLTLEGIRIIYELNESAR